VKSLGEDRREDRSASDLPAGEKWQTIRLQSVKFLFSWMGPIFLAQTAWPGVDSFLVALAEVLNTRWL